MGYHNNRNTTVTAGGGYKSGKSTELYSADNAPINYQPSDQKMKVIDVVIPTNEVPPSHIILESAKPEKELNISDDFLNCISQVYISGKYAVKGHVNLRIKQIIDLLLQNTGAYHVVVSPSLRNSLIDIIQYGKNSLLGRNVSQYERNTIISLFKYDNNMK
jgi:hypothetical protein